MGNWWRNLCIRFSRQTQGLFSCFKANDLILLLVIAILLISFLLHPGFLLALALFGLFVWLII